MPPLPFRGPLAFLATFGLALGCALDSASSPATDATGGVRLYVQPEETSPVLPLIASARASLWMEMYLLTDERAIDALVDRVRAGCDVRVILERAPYLDPGANETAHAQLTAAGAFVRWGTPRFTYTHAKTFIVDGRRLVISSANLTRSGLDTNREYTLVDDHPADVAAAEAIFAGDEVGAGTPSGGRLVVSPEGSRSTLLALIEGADSSLDLEVEHLADRAIADGLIRARARGVAVTVVLPASHAAGAVVRDLSDARVTVRMVVAPAIHAKALVVDGRAALVGSANLTPTSLDENRELGLLLDGPAFATPIVTTIADDAARGTPPPR